MHVNNSVIISNYKSKNDIEEVNNSIGHPWTKYTNNITSYPKENIKIAKINEKCVGYITFINKSEKYYYIPYMAVNKDYQGKKIGEELLTWLIKKVNEVGIKGIVLDCRESREGFYEKVAKRNNLIFKSKDNGYYFNNDLRKAIKMKLPVNSVL